MQCYVIYQDGNASYSTLDNITVHMQMKGADRVPPVGFNTNIMVGFYDQGLEVISN